MRDNGEMGQISRRDNNLWSARATAGGRISSVVKYGTAAIRRLRHGGEPATGWVEDGGLRRRAYRSDEEYVAHQRSKLGRMSGFIADVDRELERVLAERLPDGLAGKSVLCLAARLGGEVRAFRAAGAFAVGIDLNPGNENRWVLPGNFHALDFPDNSVDYVFTNSLDHAMHLDRVAAEVRRVLKPGGQVILEIGLGQAEGGEFGNWEATAWQLVDDVVAFFETEGFSADEHRPDFQVPWPGRQVKLQLPG